MTSRGAVCLGSTGSTVSGNTASTNGAGVFSQGAGGTGKQVVSVNRRGAIEQDPLGSAERSRVANEQDFGHVVALTRSG